MERICSCIDDFGIHLPFLSRQCLFHLTTHIVYHSIIYFSVRRVSPPAFDLGDPLAPKLHAILISHDHIDNFDKAAVKSLLRWSGPTMCAGRGTSYFHQNYFYCSNYCCIPHSCFSHSSDFSSASNINVQPHE